MINNVLELDVNVSVLVGGDEYKKSVYDKDIKITNVEDVSKYMYECTEWISDNSDKIAQCIKEFKSLPILQVTITDPDEDADLDKTLSSVHKVEFNTTTSAFAVCTVFGSVHCMMVEAERAHKMRNAFEKFMGGNDDTTEQSEDLSDEDIIDKIFSSDNNGHHSSRKGDSAAFGLLNLLHMLDLM